jgi:hypothetical protein
MEGLWNVSCLFDFGLQRLVAGYGLSNRVHVSRTNDIDAVNLNAVPCHEQLAYFFGMAVTQRTSYGSALAAQNTAYEVHK